MSMSSRSHKGEWLGSVDSLQLMPSTKTVKITWSLGNISCPSAEHCECEMLLRYRTADSKHSFCDENKLQEQQTSVNNTSGETNPTVKTIFRTRRHLDVNEEVALHLHLGTKLILAFTFNPYLQEDPVCCLHSVFASLGATILWLFLGQNLIPIRRSRDWLPFVPLHLSSRSLFRYAFSNILSTFLSSSRERTNPHRH